MADRSELRANRTRLKIMVANTWPFDGPPTTEDQMLSITVTNLSRHDIEMPGIDVFQPSIQRGWPIRAGAPPDGPVQVLPARSSRSLRVPLDRFVGIQRGESVVAEAVVATGERFRSAPATVTRLRESD
jgi:hypothetical protein